MTKPKLLKSGIDHCWCCNNFVVDCGKKYTNMCYKDGLPEINSLCLIINSALDLHQYFLHLFPNNP